MKKLILFLSLLSLSYFASATDFNSTYCEPLTDHAYREHIIGTWKGYSVTLNGKEYYYLTIYNKNGTFITKLIGHTDSKLAGTGKFFIKKSILTRVFINPDGHNDINSIRLLCLGPHIYRALLDKELVVNLRE